MSNKRDVNTEHLLNGGDRRKLEALRSKHLKMEMVTVGIRRFARKHEARLLSHSNVEAIQLLDNSKMLRRLQTKTTTTTTTNPPSSLYHEHSTQNT